MKKIRKVNTNKRKKERKEAQEVLQKQTAAILDHPKECSACKAEFVRTKETVQNWHVVVKESKVHLTCPRCWGIVEALLENQRDYYENERGQ
jgi:predicted RNA-binding Zn-ribbon protein involved in translation (DUF1610 family)